MCMGRSRSFVRNLKFHFLLVLLISTAVATAEQLQFTGYGYTLDRGEFRYTETHTQTIQEGLVTDWKVIYRDTNGKIIARKTLTPGNHPAIPDYRLNIPDTGYIEGIRHDDDGNVTLFVVKQDKSEEATRTLMPEDAACADSGFDAYVRQNWDTLLSGKTITFQFLVAGGLKDYKFRGKRIHGAKFEGQPVAQIKVSLDSLVGIFVDPLILAYDIETQTLKEYRGLGNIPGENGKVYPVRVSYYSMPPKEALDSIPNGE